MFNQTTINKRRFLKYCLGVYAILMQKQMFAAEQSNQPFKIFAIVYRGRTEVEKGFKSFFKDKGISIDFWENNIEQNVELIPALLKEAINWNADLIYTWGTPTTLKVCGRAVDNKRLPIPVIFVMVSAPIESGLVSSLSNFNRNLTGVVHIVPIAQQLEAIRAYRPFKRLAVLYNSDEPNSLINVKLLRQASTAFQNNISYDRSFTLIDKPIQKVNGKPSPDKIPKDLAEIAKQDPDFLYIGPDSFLAANRDLLTQVCLELKIPTFSATESILRKSKALFGLISRYDSVGRLAAIKSKQILTEDIEAKNIPIETLSRFSYVINIEVAKQINLYPPLKILNYAEIIGKNKI